MVTYTCNHCSRELDESQIKNKTRDIKCFDCFRKDRKIQEENRKKKAALVRTEYNIIGDTDIDTSNIELFCDACNLWKEFNQFKCEFKKTICKDCGSKMSTRKRPINYRPLNDKVAQSRALAFNKRYENDGIKMCQCKNCFRIKKADKFIGFDGVTKKCDNCRGNPVITENNKNKPIQCQGICGEIKPIKLFTINKVRCDLCQKIFEKERNAKKNENKRKKYNEFKKNNKNKNIDICDKCFKTYNIVMFENKKGDIVLRCDRCRHNDKYYETNIRDKEAKNQHDRETYQENIKIIEEFRIKNNDKTIDICNDCKFVGKIKDHFITDNGVRILYCVNKCYKNRNKAEENRKGERHQGAEPNAKIYQTKEYAKDNGFPYELSHEEAFDIVTSDCFYCTYEPTEKSISGIDAYKHSKGFVCGNVVPACTSCNHGKGSGKAKQFIRRARHIVSYRNPHKYQWEYWEYFPDTKSITYIMYKSNAKKKGKRFALTEEQFNNIVSQPCHYCGKKNSETHRNGVDRKISSKELGYCEENCVSACSACNYMKHVCPYDEFLDKMEKIAINSTFIALK